MDSQQSILWLHNNSYTVARPRRSADWAKCRELTELWVARNAVATGELKSTTATATATAATVLVAVALAKVVGEFI